MLTMLLVEVQRVTAHRESKQSGNMSDNSLHSASKMISWLLHKYAEVSKQSESKNTDVLKKILGLIGIKQMIM